MSRFILNNHLIETDLSSGTTVLDFVRYHEHLPGTKIGCREGDCGACTVLVGDAENDCVVYRAMTSCLLPLGNVNGKHVVTVEGINMSGLSPVQQILVDAGGTQCGFCTIGFIMSLTGFVLNSHSRKYEEAIAAIDGNICRCTGYKSIERATELLAEKINAKSETATIPWLVENNFIPAYFLEMHSRLLKLKDDTAILPAESNNHDGKMMVGGATDLMVQKQHEVNEATIHHLFDNASLKKIYDEDTYTHVGASVTVTEFAESEWMQRVFPGLKAYIRLVSSTPIRNMATLGGNLVNASPIGDMSIFFLALDSELLLNKNGIRRKIKLRDFYKSYKQLDKDIDEILAEIIFKTPDLGALFNFEKVSKRTWLDIASVNSACQVKLNKEGAIEWMHLSAGGVAPIPKYFSNTVSFLTGKILSRQVFREALNIMNEEIAPIGDARGTADYKKLLLRQLFTAHLLKFFGMTNVMKEILNDIRNQHAL